MADSVCALQLSLLELSEIARACIEALPVIGAELETEDGRSEGARSQSGPAQQVASLFQRLQGFDSCLLALNRCKSITECVPLVKSRHTQCVELLPVIAEVPIPAVYLSLPGTK